MGYPRPGGRLSTCYSPVRHSRGPKPLAVRLACLKRAASVRSEPGSNSPSFSSGVERRSSSTSSLPLSSRGYSSPAAAQTLAFTFVRELTWKPLHLYKIHTLQLAIACNNFSLSFAYQCHKSGFRIPFREPRIWLVAKHLSLACSTKILYLTTSVNSVSTLFSSSASSEEVPPT